MDARMIRGARQTVRVVSGNANLPTPVCPARFKKMDIPQLKLKSRCTSKNYADPNLKARKLN